MYKIKLIGELNPELKMLGCKPGDEVMATMQLSNLSMWFHTTYNGHTMQCVVYPDNYEIIHMEYHGSNNKIAPPKLKYFVSFTPGTTFENRRNLKNEISHFIAKHNHTVITDTQSFLDALKLWCFNAKVKYDEHPERKSYFAMDCFMVQLIEVKKEEA
ncbi:MAG: hypothetical protein JXR36_08120 [Bacteroidales bacterium]|nr:hypothetical protein [Bacteroidales bacterium]